MPPEKDGEGVVERHLDVGALFGIEYHEGAIGREPLARELVDVLDGRIFPMIMGKSEPTHPIMNFHVIEHILVHLI